MPPTNMPTFFSGAPDNSRVTKYRPANRIAAPRLGWIISNRTMSPVQIRMRLPIGKLGSRSFQLLSQAMKMAKPGFRNSDGWNRMPMSIQRLAPFTSVPKMGTRNSHSVIATARTIPMRRAVSLPTVLRASSTLSAMNCQTRWRQKK